MNTKTRSAIPSSFFALSIVISEASFNESWQRCRGVRVSQQLIESEPGFIVVMGDLGQSSARSPDYKTDTHKKLREIQLPESDKYSL